MPQVTSLCELNGPSSTLVLFMSHRYLQQPVHDPGSETSRVKEKFAKRSSVGCGTDSRVGCENHIHKVATNTGHCH